VRLDSLEFVCGSRTPLHELAGVENVQLSGVALAMHPIRQGSSVHRRTARRCVRIRHGSCTPAGTEICNRKLFYLAVSHGDARVLHRARTGYDARCGGVSFALRGRCLEDVLVIEPSEACRIAIEAVGARTIDPTVVDVTALNVDTTDGSGAKTVYDAAGARSAVATALMTRLGRSEGPFHTGTQLGRCALRSAVPRSVFTCRRHGTVSCLPIDVASSRVLRCEVSVLSVAVRSTSRR